VAIVVSDTSPLAALAFLRHLEFLRRFYHEVLIPPAVADEIQKPGWDVFAAEVLNAEYLKIQSPKSKEQVVELAKSLDRGEAEAIALAMEVNADAILIDEAAGRVAAIRLGLRPIGALGLLIRAKREGIIPTIGPEIKRLRTGLGFRISDKLLAQVLADAGE